MQIHGTSLDSSKFRSMMDASDSHWHVVPETLQEMCIGAIRLTAVYLATNGSRCQVVALSTDVRDSAGRCNHANKLRQFKSRASNRKGEHVFIPSNWIVCGQSLDVLRIIQ